MHVRPTRWLFAVVLLSMAAGTFAARATPGHGRALRIVDATDSVFADSARTLVDATTGWHSGVGFFKVDLGNGRVSFCTGAMIKSNKVLTAAHCLYDDNGQLHDIQKITFQPGVTNGQAVDPYPGGIGVVRAVPHPTFAQLEAQSRDYSNQKVKVDLAVLTLARDVDTQKTAIFELAPSCAVRTGAQLSVQLAGYPKDAPFATMAHTDCTIIKGTAVGQDDDCSDQILFHQCSIRGGNSGGPLWHMDNATGKAYIFATQGGENGFGKNPDADATCRGLGVVADSAQCENTANELDDEHIQFINSN